MAIRMTGRTDVGRTRSRNEDALLQRPDRGLLAVADGMGGHAAGDIASRIAVDVVDDRSAHLPDTDLPAYLHDTVRHAHEAILRAAAADAELEGMGTTLTVARVDPADHHCVIAHVGDSRAYLWRDGRLGQLTRDQTWVQQQIDSGRLSPERARGHPFSAMLTCALGIDGVDLEVQLLEPELRDQDILLVCSDGLTGPLSDDDLREILGDHLDLGDDPVDPPDLDRAAQALVDAANEAGGPDNITVGLLLVSG